MLGNLHGVTSRRRDLPNLAILAGSEVDPLAIVRPARFIISTHIDVELVGHSTARIDKVDVGYVAPYPGVEGDQLSIGRPARRASNMSVSNELSCNGFEPSESETQISKLPDRFDMKAILVPSGE